MLGFDLTFWDYMTFASLLAAAVCGLVKPCVRPPRCLEN
jgi:hypothetical protein